MSAFPKTGRSEVLKIVEMRVRFRPIADVLFARYQRRRWAANCSSASQNRAVLLYRMSRVCTSVKNCPFRADQRHLTAPGAVVCKYSMEAALSLAPWTRPLVCSE